MNVLSKISDRLHKKRLQKTYLNVIITSSVPPFLAIISFLLLKVYTIFWLLYVSSNIVGINLKAIEIIIAKILVFFPKGLSKDSNPLFKSVGLVVSVKTADEIGV